MKSEVMLRRFLSVLVLAVFVAAANSCAAENSDVGGYEDLLALFEDWREFERPAMRDGAPDYTAERFTAAHEESKI